MAEERVKCDRVAILGADLVGYSRQIHEDEIKMMIRGDMRVNIPSPLPRFTSATDAGVR